MIASLTLNIFHKHADRVQMANIAQMVNVLQAMILTEGAEMIKTPTYHVFDLYKNHQDATLVDADGVISGTTSYTVSKKDGVMTASFCNYSLTDTETITLSRVDGDIRETAAEGIFGNSTDDHNSFENPEAVAKQTFTDFAVDGNELTITLPPMSVVSVYAKEN